MKRFLLFIGLAVFYTFSMIAVGGYNVSSDAAQLWNNSSSGQKKQTKPLWNAPSSPDSGKKKGRYYNQQGAGNSYLFNGRKAHIKRKETHGDRVARDYMVYQNQRRSNNRIPSVFSKMSPYSVSNRLDDIEMALERQSQRRKASFLMLKRMRNEDAKHDQIAFRRKNKQNFMKKVASRFGKGTSSTHKRRKGSGARSSSYSASSSGRTSTNETESNSTVHSVGGKSKLYNAR